MDWRQWDPPPVGVGLLSSPHQAPVNERTGFPLYQGVSYCDAVRRAGEGEILRVLPGSVQVCHWAPVILGLKEPQGRFEQGLSPRLDYPVPGLLLAPLDRFPGEPNVVLVRAGPGVLGPMLQRLDPEWVWAGHRDRVDRSALSRLAGQRQPPGQGLVGLVNGMLAALARSARWQALTRWLFRSKVVTVAFEAIISRTLADMSLCRNSTVIPLLTGQVNASYFCTGGITWGRNRPEHLTSGWPYPLFMWATQPTSTAPRQPAAQGSRS